MKSPLSILQDIFGFQDFRGVQRQVIDRVMAGQHSLAVMPTGAGKSLCYQVPALARPGTALVISPLIALMHDQMRAADVSVSRRRQTRPHQPRRSDERMKGGEMDLLLSAERADRSAFRI